MQNSVSFFDKIVAAVSACAITAIMLSVSVSVPLNTAIYSSQVLV